MQINRNNYEDFFLLYADGELRTDECKAVENFIAENEDLRIELEMLKAAVLPNEELVFIDKSFLYKETVFDKKIEEKLLLKLDGELSAQELAKTNATIATDDNVKKLYELLQRTKLDSTETIIFEEKQLLYKKEKDNVIAFRWLKWAAAAIFVGFGIFTVVNLLNKNSKPSSINIANTNPTKSDIKIPDTITNTIQNSNNASKSTFANIENKKEQNSKGEINITEKPLAKKQINTNKEKINNKPINNIVPENKNEGTLVKTENNFIAKENLIFTEQKEVISIAANTMPIKTKDISNENTVPLEDTYSKAMAIENIEKSENKILYMDEDDVKKTKVGGFFRKVKRFVERTANIKPGNSLQIAGFEIASK